MKNFIVIGFIFSLIIACSPIDNEVTFSVMGDVPRSDAENILVQEHIQLHNQKSNSEFMFHVGDIKDGKSPCSEDVYLRVAGYFKKLSVPMFIVPGDNEWNDCPDVDAAWENWTNYFMNFENNWKNDFNVSRQIDREENFAFTYKDVLFIGINLVGGTIHDAEEWKNRHSQNAEWIESQFSKSKTKVRTAVIIAQANPDEKHIDFMEKFLKSAENFSKPIIFIHGDGHHWIYEKEWKLKNIVRIQVDKGGIAQPLKVTINDNYDEIISVDRNQFGMNFNN